MSSLQGEADLRGAGADDHFFPGLDRMRFDDTIIRELGDQAHAVSLGTGDVLVEEGAAAHEVFYVRSGRLAVTSKSSAGQVLLGHVTAGELVGEVAVVAGRQRTATLSATESSVVVAVPRAAFETWLSTRADVSQSIAAAARERIDRSQVAAMITDLFGTDDVRLVQDVLNTLEWRHLEAGDVLFTEGDPSDAAYFVVSGRLTAQATGDQARDTGPRDTGLRELVVGQIVGELGLLDSSARTATVRAARDTTLAKFSNSGFESLIAAHPALALHMARGVLALLRAPRRASNRGTSVAVAVTAPIDCGAFVDAMEQEIARHGTVTRLSSGRIDSLLNEPGISQAGITTVGLPRLTEFLHEVELEHRHVLYQADAEPTAWSRRALRHADRCVIVCSAHPDGAEVRRIQEFLSQLPPPARATSWLAVMHPRGVTQSRGAAELRKRYDVGQVIHLRADDPGAIARMARTAVGHGVGLVLGGGGARGFAHLGVFRALEELGLPVDRVGGASIGAPIGAGMALGMDAAELTQEVTRQFHRLKDYTLPVVSILGGRRIAKNITQSMGGLDVEDLVLPYYCVSTNLTQSRLEVHRHGDLARAVRASVAIPGVLPPVASDGDLLVDGGVLSNLPVGPMRADNAVAHIIAVDVAPPDGPRARVDFGLSVSGWRALARSIGPGRSPYPGVASVLMRTMIVASMRDRNELLSQHNVDLHLGLEMRGVGLLAFEQVRSVADAGYEAAMPRIEAWLNQPDSPAVTGSVPTSATP